MLFRSAGLVDEVGLTCGEAGRGNCRHAEGFHHGAVGVGKQGVLDRIDRLEALLRYHRPDEKIARAARRTDRERLQRLPIEQAWLGARRNELRAVITGLVDQANRFDVEERDWVDELDIDGRGDDITPATMVILGLASAELRAAPGVLGLDSSRPNAVHALLARADDLRSQFAGLGSKTPPCTVA